jgi:alpha-tubulin suppressor-like RCC1 family protein
MGLKQNTWKLNQWYDQSVAGNAGYAAFSIGGLWSWGDGYRGQTSHNNQTDYSSPKQVGSATTWADIATTTNYGGAAINTDGELWTWGINGGGELGQNQAYPGLNAVSSPVQVPGTTWASRSDEEFGSDRSKIHLTGNTAAIKTDGTLWVWGYNQYGNVANNTAGGVAYSSPVQVPGTTWKYISSAGVTMGGIKTDGTLWTWGKNGGGRMANNAHSANTAYSSPVQVPGTTWRTISFGAFNVFATKTDGTLWSWGYNTGGSLGQNQSQSTLGAYSSPVQIPGTNWKQGVAGTNDEAAAVKTDGTLWTWGRNEEGLLGQNQAHDARISSPAQVPGTTWKNVECMTNGMFGTKTDGTLWSWGSNADGALGINQPGPTKRSSPVQIPGTTWKRVVGGKNNAFGYATKS